jgi:two-component sensor histidine kinase
MSQLQSVTSSSADRVGPMILVEEISHRVVNEYTQAIAGIRLAAAGIASQEAREALTEAATKLRCFAEAHRALQLPRTSDDVDLGGYLSRLCAASMAAGLQERGVRLRLSCDAIHLSSERCWRVALIISELVTNSARHGLRGGPGHVVIQITEDADGIECRVSDNGCAEADAQPARGLTVVKGLAAELGGEVCWFFGLAGATALLTFPSGVRERAA